MWLSDAEIADQALLEIAEKLEIGLTLNEYEWRLWLTHNWQSLHFDLPSLRDRKVQYGVPKDGYRQNMGPAMSGIYFLFCGDELQYIGKASNLSQRLWRHFVDRPNWDHVTWIEAPVECCEEVEHYYIHEFNPPQNVRRLARGDLMRKLVKANANTPDLRPSR